MKNERSRKLLIAMFIALLCSLFFSVSIGVINTPLSASVKSLIYAAGFPVAGIDPQQQLVLWSIRWPRTLLATIVGAGLAICGATMQGLFRSPLADPSIIGVSSGASVGAAAAIVLGSSLSPDIEQALFSYGFLLNYIVVSAMAFVGGFIAAIVVYRLGTSRGVTSVAAMLLAGIAISALAGAFNNIFSFIADDMALRRISLWRMGSFDGANWSQVGICASLIGIVIAALSRYGKVLNTLLLGESEARHLGVNVQSVKLQLTA